VDGVWAMKTRALITGIAALLLSEGAAHATNVEIPEDLLGRWCYDEKASPNYYEEVYTDRDDCDQDYSYIWKDGDKYGYNTDLFNKDITASGRDYCTFDKIEEVEVKQTGEDDPLIFSIHANCWSGWNLDPAWTEIFELIWQEGILTIKRPAETN